MKLTVRIPSEILLDEPVVKVKAEASNGWFCLLPRHVDFVTALVPGILCFHSPDGRTGYLAIDHGILVKCGPQVSVSTRRAACGEDLPALKETVEKRFRAIQERERAARIHEARLEAELVRQLVELEKHA